MQSGDDFTVAISRANCSSGARISITTWEQDLLCPQSDLITCCMLGDTVLTDNSVLETGPTETHRHSSPVKQVVR